MYHNLDSWEHLALIIILLKWRKWVVAIWWGCIKINIKSQMLLCFLCFRTSCMRLFTVLFIFWQKMTMDIKLNPMQHSVATLEKLCFSYYLHKDKNPLIVGKWNVLPMDKCNAIRFTNRARVVSCNGWSMDSYLKLIGSYEQNVVTTSMRFVLTLLMLLMYYHYKILLLLLNFVWIFVGKDVVFWFLKLLLPKKINRWK